MMRVACIGILLAILVFCTGCMGINAPAMPKVQPLTVNIEKNNAQMIDKNAPKPTPTANITVTQTTPAKYKYV